MNQLLKTIAMAIGAVLAIIVFTLGPSALFDLGDGGNAQVVYVQPPAQIDQAFAETYRTVAQGNKYNAEGDALTTTANAEANQAINGTLMGWVALGGLALVALRMTRQK